MNKYMGFLMAMIFGANAAAADLQQPWLKPTAEGWAIKPLLNVGEGVGKNNYRMVGVPDGLVTLDNFPADRMAFEPATHLSTA